MTTLDDSVRAEIKTLRASGELDFNSNHKTSLRCYVCCEAESRDLVNKLLAAGLTTREIADSCGYINDRREAKGDNRLIDAPNIRSHRREHYNLDKPVQAAYRAIFERRAAEANRDYEEGFGTAITPYAALETTIAKGYQNLTEESTTVSVGELITASVKFQEMTNKDQDQRKMADLLFTMDRLITAAQEFIDPSQHGAFLAKVRGEEDVSPGEVIVVSEQQSIREFTPVVSADEGDEI